MKFSKKTEWVPTDGWRGYIRPVFAVAGSSDTGTWSDSPCPSALVTGELERLRLFLRSKGFHVRNMVCRSANVFMVKRWIIVAVEEFDKAVKVAEDWLKDNMGSTRFIHER